MTDTLYAFLLSTGVIFVAELGDKSQLMALTFATRYRALPVLVGITVATAVVHAVSVGVGYGLGTALPTGWIALVAGRRLPRLRRWTLRGDSLTDDEQAKAERSTRLGAGRGRRWRSSSPSWATRRCSPRSPWPRSTAGSAPGSARRSAWSPPTRWRSSSAACSAGTCPSSAIKYGASALFAIFGVALIAQGAGWF